MSVIDVQTSRDVNLLTGAEVVRVRYRERGTRLWTKLIVVPGEGQSVDELMWQGDEIARAHMLIRGDEVLAASVDAEAKT